MPKNILKMSRKGIVKEHKELIKTLKKGSRKDLNYEAKEQGKELKRYRKGKV